MFLWLISRDLDGNDKVSGVSSGGEGAASVTGLVDRGSVGGAVGDLTSLAWLHPDLRNSKNWL